MTKVLIFIVAYNAEKLIQSVLARIPASLLSDPSYSFEILIIDDSSKDDTFAQSHAFGRSFTACPLTILKNPKNLGYGGNQKLGYHYAIDRGFDVVVLLHGDGQYAPEELPNLLKPFSESNADAVFGSRMMSKVAETGRSSALTGGMPLYKYVGNRILTFLQNSLVGTKLSEWHSGYRLYSTNALRKVPFEQNSNGFDFDTDIILQLHKAGCTITERAIPTYYGDEICHVNGIQYGCKILATCVNFNIQKLGLLYDPKFDLESANFQYRPKFDFLSSHSLALRAVAPGEKLLLLGCGPYETVTPYFERTPNISVVDQYLDDPLRQRSIEAWEADLDTFHIAELSNEKSYDKVLVLDVIEHLRSPEAFLADLRIAPRTQGSTIVITTPNIAFLPIRLMLALGSFNYGKRGILDRTHTRLFTFSSLKRLFEQCGYELKTIRGIPAPIPLALGKNTFAEFLLSLNNLALKVFPTLFSYQIYLEARPIPTVQQLLKNAQSHSTSELERLQNGGAAK